MPFVVIFSFFYLTNFSVFISLVADLKANTRLNGYTMESPQIIWLYEVLESLDKMEKGMFLQFVTGSSKIPLEGFKSIQGMDGITPFMVTRIREKDVMSLPRSHTW